MLIRVGVGLIAVGLTMGPVSCQTPSPVAGKVTERIARDSGGVDLRVQHDNGNVRLHSYTTPQKACAVGARWPDCVRDEGAR